MNYLRRLIIKPTPEQAVRERLAETQRNILLAEEELDAASCRLAVLKAREQRLQGRLSPSPVFKVVK